MARTHIIIPIHIWHMEDLSVTERLVASIVHGYTEHGKPCFMTNNGFSKLLHVSSRTASRAVSNLIEKGVLQEMEGGHKRHLKCAKCLGGVDTSVVGGWTPVSTRNNKINNKPIDKINKMDERKDEVKPIHWQQVRDYFLHLNDQERTTYRSHIEPWAKDFFTYYDARSWRNKNGPITKWRPVALAWYRRSAKKVPNRAVKRISEEQLRSDLRWHQRRLDNYLKDERRDLALGESRAIEGIKNQLKQYEG